MRNSALVQNQKFPEVIHSTTSTGKRNWQENPFHPSLEFKEIKSKDNIWSVRIGIGWRALGIVKANEDKIVWFWIGSHAEYDKILRKK